MRTNDEPLSSTVRTHGGNGKKILVKSIVIIAVVCVIGVLILNKDSHGNQTVRSFLQRQVSTDVKNGNKASDGQFKSVVGITFWIMGPMITDQNKHSCTGVMLTKRHVLTAGHCCYGAYGFYVHTGIKLGQQSYSVLQRNVWYMKNYKYNTTKDAKGKTVYTPENDICIIETNRDVDKTVPVKIASSTVDANTDVDIVGFGMTGPEENSNKEGNLHYAQTKVTNCDNALKWAKNRQNVINDIVCAGHAGSWNPMKWTHAKNACSGDSGGPLLSVKSDPSDATPRTVYGILSDGDKPCEEGTNSYVDITKQKFADFIKKHVP